MTSHVTTAIHCDHLGCEAAVEGRDVVAARRTARRSGWAVGVRRHGLAHDYCPQHREPRR